LIEHRTLRDADVEVPGTSCCTGLVEDSARDRELQAKVTDITETDLEAVPAEHHEEAPSRGVRHEPDTTR
jgi:hypothetical protein